MEIYAWVGVLENGIYETRKTWHAKLPVFTVSYQVLNRAWGKNFMLTCTLKWSALRSSEYNHKKERGESKPEKKKEFPAILVHS